MTADLTTQPGAVAPDVSPDDVRPVVGRRLTSPSFLALCGLYAAAGGHAIAALVHLSHGWGMTVFFLVVAAVQVWAAGRLARGAGGLATGAVLAATLGLVLL